VLGYYARLGKVAVISGADQDMRRNAVASLKYDVTLAWGGPGSPVSELCTIIGAEYNMTHLVYSDIVESSISRGTPEAIALRAVMDSGGIPTAKMKVSLVKAAMAACKSKSKRFLIQGFPKNADEADLFTDTVAPIRSVLNFSLTDNLLAKACLDDENKKRGRAPPAEDADPEEVAAAEEKAIAEVIKAMQDKPWDAPQDTPEAGLNWDRKVLTDKPGFVIKKSDREPSIAEQIAKRIVEYNEDIVGLNAYFTAADSQTAAGIQVVPSSSTADAMQRVTRLLRSSIICVEGPAGSGKDAAVTQLCQEEGYKCIEVSTLLDNAVATGAREANAITKAIANGHTPPTSVCVALIKQAMRAAEGHKFVLDGYFLQAGGRYTPLGQNQRQTQSWRTHDHYFLLEQELGAVGKIIFFDAPADVRQKRCSAGGMSNNQFEDLEDEFAKAASPIISFAEKIGKLGTVKATGTPAATFASLKESTDSLKALGVWA